MNFVEGLERTVERYPEKTVLIWEGKELTYYQLTREVNRCGNALLSLGIGPGDRVALMMNNRPEFVVTYYGTCKIGATVVLVNTLLKENEIIFILKDSEAIALVANENGAREFLAAREELPRIKHLVCTSPVEGAVTFEDFLAGRPEELEVYPVQDEDVPEIKYTSGTTGNPKGVMHTHRNITVFAEAIIGLNQVSPADRTLLFLPMYHGFGDMCTLHPTLFNGGSIVLQDPLNLTRVFEDIERYRCTALPGVPAVFYLMNTFPDAGKYDTSSLRFCAGGGQPMPKEVIEEFEAKFGCIILEGYGLTESTAGTSTNRLYEPRKVGSVGLPLDCAEVKIVDDAGNEVPVGEPGEIIIRSELNMKGYLNRPQETAEVLKEGWLYSGDIGKFDEDGYLYIVDRKKEMIITSGENVYPSEVERIIQEHPAVGLVAVVAAPDPRRGEIPKAIVALKPGGSLSEQELTDWCKERMAVFKVPKMVEFRESLPVGPTGKVQKKLL
jgi:long-chain acyl-CoA synthetase